jgi:hypothetical protein
LSRLGKTDAEKNVSVWSVTRLVNKPLLNGTGNWSVTFPVEDKATYLLLCHSYEDGTKNDYAEVTITDVAAASGPLQIFLSFTSPPPSFTTTSITANGSVLYPDNQVTCTLTPIDCNNGAAKSKAAVQLGNWTNNPTDTLWSVAFTRPMGNPFLGCYLLEATAGSEGTISVSGSV